MFSYFSSEIGGRVRSGGAGPHQLYLIVEITASAYDTGLHLITIDVDGEDIRAEKLL